MRAIIEIPAEISSFRNASMRVLVERARYADARSEIVLEARINDVTHQEGQKTNISCQLPEMDLADWSGIIVRAHVDLDGDGEVSKGDLLNQQACPLSRSSSEVTVIVEKVGS